MRRCLELAERGRGCVGNGALVGAVLVRDGEILDEDYHHGFGKAHAERQLLQQLTKNISDDDILYVNLEPCCHYGKTPPCTDIILEKRIKTVVYGMKDPDPRVSGRGIERLQNAGVTVIGPVLQPFCERLNRGFVSVRTKQRPYITLKQARKKDGRIASADGSPLKITTKEQDIWSHTRLRAEHDAILVGVHTIECDNPRLDTHLDARKRNLHPYRIILDRILKTPVNARVVSDDYCKRTIIVHGPIINQEMEIRRKEFELRKVILREVPLIDNVFDWSALWSELMTPRGEYHGLTSILVEGGQKTWDIFKNAKMIDEEIILIGN